MSNWCTTKVYIKKIKLGTTRLERIEQSVIIENVETPVRPSSLRLPVPVFEDLFDVKTSDSNFLNPYRVELGMFKDYVILKFITAYNPPMELLKLFKSRYNAVYTCVEPLEGLFINSDESREIIKDKYYLSVGCEYVILDTDEELLEALDEYGIKVKDVKDALKQKTQRRRKFSLHKYETLTL